MSEIQEPEWSENSTYDLDPAPGGPGDEVEEEPQRPTQSPRAVGQPLPRLWKAEPDPHDESDGTDAGRPVKKSNKGGSENNSTNSKSSSPRVKASPPKVKAKKKPADDGDDGEKKVLIEETPTFDTYEARQRVRLIVGGLGAFCVFLFCYIGYRVLFGPSSEADLSAQEPPMTQAAAPAGSDALEREARYMLHRAQEFAKGGRIDQAVGMLKRVEASYKGTLSAAEAHAALERPKHKLPLFPEGPALLAERKPVQTPPPLQATSIAIQPGPQTAPIGPVAMGPAPVPTGPPPSQTLPPPAQPAFPQPPPSLPPSVQSQPVPSSTPAQAPPMQAPPMQAPPVQPPPVQTQPIPTQPTQVMPPTGPGHVAMVVPAPPAGPAAMPPTVVNKENDRAAIAPVELPPRMLPPGFKAKVEAGRHESGWPLVIVSERDGATMVLVPGGTFTMGDDRGNPEEAPAHTVRLSTFYIDQHEVTIRQFRTFLEKSHYPGKASGGGYSEERLRDASADSPAVFVNYREAENFALWAGKRLPTEAQWEMAARSTDGRRYPWGDQPIKWSKPRELHQVDPVMSFPEDSSVYGVYDMAGNVMEWTRDWYDARYFQKFANKIAENPTGPATQRLHSIQRVVKGGSKNGSVAARQGVDGDKRLAYLGFRGSLAVEGPEASAGIAPHPPKPDAQPSIPPPGNSPPAGTVPF